MRNSCRFLLLASLVSVPALAKAVTIRIQDPAYSNITTSPTQFNFLSCPNSSSQGGEYLDNGTPITSDGCFGGVNQSALTISSITLTFENTAAVQASGANIASSDIFQNASFTAPADLTNGSENYTFSFSGSGLVEGQTFVITEDGVDDPSDFPTVSLAFTTIGASVTPEPASFLLLGTGLTTLACFCRKFRRA